MTLRVRLFLLVLAALTPGLATQIYNQLGFRLERRAEAERRAQSEAARFAGELEQIASGMRKFLLAAANSAQSLPAAHGCNAYLATLRQQLPGALVLGASDVEGKVYCYTEPFQAGKLDNGDRMYVRRALASSSFSVGEYMLGRQSGKPAIAFAYPLPHDAADRAQGVVFGSVGLNWLTDYLAHKNLPPWYTLTVVDRNGTVLVRLPERDRAGSKIPTAWQQNFSARGATVEAAQDPFNGVSTIFAFEPSATPANGLGVVVGVDAAHAMAFADLALQRAVAIVGVGLIIALVLAWLIAREGIERPLQALLDAARLWRSGDYTARSRLRHSPAEISRLAAVFDAMAESLQLREADRSRNELALRRSHDAALKANLSKTQFLASASHDLRQPLHALSLAVAVMQARHADDADTAHVERIGRSVRSLSNLLNALLDVSQLDAGLVQPSISNFSVANIFDEIAEQFTDLATQKQITLHIERCDLAVRSDRQLLGRMLKNLVSNAIKYTPAGGSVRVHAYDDCAQVVVVITDNGIGIAAEQQERVFADFLQLNNPERDRNKGLGLGLAIVRRMSELLNHPVTLDSTPGEGSVFSVSVTRSTDHFDDSRSVPIRYHYEGRILLVEDDPLVAEATAELLTVWGAQVSAVGSGEAALLLMQDPALHFDAVIADYRLPLMNGAQVVKAAMARWPAIRAVVVTGNSMEGVLRETRVLGASLLQKPIRTAALVEILCRR